MATDLVLSRRPGERASAWAARLEATDARDWSGHQRAMLAHAIAFAADLARSGGDALLPAADPTPGCPPAAADRPPVGSTALEEVLRLLLRLSPSELRRVGQWIENREAANRPA
jgi:hypothetical protein